MNFFFIKSLYIILPILIIKLIKIIILIEIDV